MTPSLEVFTLAFRPRRLISQDLRYQRLFQNTHSSNLYSCKWRFVHQMLRLQPDHTRILCPPVRLSHQGHLLQENRHHCHPCQSKRADRSQGASPVLPVRQRNPVKSSALESQKLESGAQECSRLGLPYCLPTRTTATLYRDSVTSILRN
jgi:hypothetical protein